MSTIFNLNFFFLTILFFYDFQCFSTFNFFFDRFSSGTQFIKVKCSSIKEKSKGIIFLYRIFFLVLSRFEKLLVQLHVMEG